MKKIKAVIVLAFFGFGLVVFGTSDRLVTKVQSLPGGAPPGVTGAPGESTCSKCHDGGEGPGTFTITAPPLYQPGQTYQIQVRHVNPDPSRRRWGFELTALAGIDAAGTFNNLSGATQTVNEFNRF